MLCACLLVGIGQCLCHQLLDVCGNEDPDRSISTWLWCANVCDSIRDRRHKVQACYWHHPLVVVYPGSCDYGSEGDVHKRVEMAHDLLHSSLLGHNHSPVVSIICELLNLSDGPCI